MSCAPRCSRRASSSTRSRRRRLPPRKHPGLRTPRAGSQPTSSRSWKSACREPAVPSEPGSRPRRTRSPARSKEPPTLLWPRHCIGAWKCSAFNRRRQSKHQPRRRHRSRHRRWLDPPRPPARPPRRLRSRQHPPGPSLRQPRRVPGRSRSGRRFVPGPLCSSARRRWRRPRPCDWGRASPPTSPRTPSPISGCCSRWSSCTSSSPWARSVKW